MDLIRQAGFAIYPVLVFGVAALVLSARQVMRRSSRDPRVARLLGLTAVAGGLGTVTGVQASVGGLEGTGAEPSLVLFGLAESLHNLTAALVLIALTLLVLLAAPIPKRAQSAAVGA